ncbi:LuxR family glucitol operon transcriptional activator [Neobacillus sp. B4I6]|uniref:tetratricopeptide repeat protein n=1 Tax=Neobacillus sp. B4I6 TaxID=3373925 RepID=UPI003D220AED
MAELEDQKDFAELLSSGVKSLKLHPDFKIRRGKNEINSSGQSYLEKVAYQLGVSSNTIKSWIGQMGLKYIPGRIDDGKLFGIIWVIIEKSDMNIQWFTKLLETTSIPVIKPALPIWVVSCLKKAKILLNNGAFGAPLDEDIENVINRLFPDTQISNTITPKEQPMTHNLPTRWSGGFIGRSFDLEAIRQWVLSPSPVCTITGWAGMGKTTIALEVAYACVGGNLHGDSVNVGENWPTFRSIIWVSADWKGLTFSDFLNTIAYQLGRVEQIDKSINEKRFVVRNALANYSRQEPVLLIVDSIDTAESDIHDFITNLPQGVKVILTSRENLYQKYREAFREMVTIQLKGLEKTEAFDFFTYEVRRQLQTCNSPDKREKIEQLLNISPEIQHQLFLATAGNPKAIALSIAYISDDDIPAQQLIQELGKAGYTLLEMFDFLFGRTWKRCDEGTRRLWQVLCFFSKPPDEESWAAAAGLDVRNYHYAVEKMRTFALIQPERIEGKLYFLGHQTVVAYGEQHLLENQDFEKEARSRWSRYYIQYLETHLKREQLNSVYWSYLLGRDLDKIKKEWPNILKVIKWASQVPDKELLIDLVTRISHFLSRINLPLRIEYGLKAADYANQLDKKTHEAFLRIDTVGWALIEVNELDEALQQIEAGLQILEHLDSNNADVFDLKVWGLALKSRLFLKSSDPEKAEAILREVIHISATPIIQHRVLLVRGDLSLLRKNYKEAINLYEAANQISTMYGGEKTIEAYFNLGLAYVNCDEFEKAEAAFDNILYHKNKANQIELIYYHYGMAQMFSQKGDNEKALQSNQIAINLIDSWEPTISIRIEVEQFNDVIESNLHI